MKTIRIQKKIYPIGVRLPMLPSKELRAAGTEFLRSYKKNI